MDRPEGHLPSMYERASNQAAIPFPFGHFVAVLPCAGVAGPRVPAGPSQPGRPAAPALVPVPVGLPPVQVVLQHVPHLGVEEAIRKGYHEAL